MKEFIIIILAILLFNIIFVIISLLRKKEEDWDDISLQILKKCQEKMFEDIKETPDIFEYFEKEGIEPNFLGFKDKYKE